MDVVPAADMEGREVEDVVIGGRRHAPPPRVRSELVLSQLADDRHRTAPQVRRPDRPLAAERIQHVPRPRGGVGRTLVVPGELGDHQVERRRGEPAKPLVLDLPLRGHGGEQSGRPAHAEAEPERAAGVEGAGPQIGGAARGSDDVEVRRPGDGRHPLGIAHVGGAEHADPPVRPRLPRRPLHRVVAVLHVAAHVAPPALALEAAAAVLQDDAEPGLDHPVQREACGQEGPVVRRPHEQHRNRLPRIGPPDVCEQPDAIAHGDGDTVLLNDAFSSHRASLSRVSSSNPTQRISRLAAHRALERGDHRVSWSSSLEDRPSPPARMTDAQEIAMTPPRRYPTP